MFGLFRKPRPVPTWTGQRTNEIASCARWQECNVPDELRGLPDAFRRTIRYPFLGSYFGHERMTFCYVLPQGVARGYVYRVSGGDDILNQQMLEYILYEVMEYAEAAYAGIVKPMQEKVRAIEKAKQDAARAVEVFAARFKQAVEADAKGVVAALQAGKQAQLRDWLNEMKPPEALYDQLRRVVLATARDVENQREAEERKRQEAVREAERRIAEEREAARKRLLSGPIPFAGVVAGNVVFGTEVETGDTFMVDVRKLQHTICVGVSGSGKSVLLHLLVHQMMALPEFEQVILVDLKDGVEFNTYRDNSKAQVVWEFDDLVRVVDRLNEVARERAAVMRENRWQLWPHGRIALVIDEFAELQTEIDTADDKEKKARARRLSASLLSLARRARAFEIILTCALQKATDDQIPSALRNNLGCRLVLRCGSSVTARSMLEIDDEYDALPVRPTRLRDGRLYYYDARRGDVRYLQAHVVPGVELG
jgi:ATPase subunit of ABC transporter with duplicated ATPase domains